MLSFPARSFCSPEVPDSIDDKLASYGLARDDPEDFTWGKLRNNNKTYGVHRDMLLPKAEATIEFAAKKARELYFNEGFMPPEIPELDSIRLREPTDTIQKLKENKEVAVSILKRDEFVEDTDFVISFKSGFYIRRCEAGHCRPFIFNINGEKVMAVLEEALFHQR